MLKDATNDDFQKEILSAAQDEIQIFILKLPTNYGL
jgi:hypothetical protein